LQILHARRKRAGTASAVRRRFASAVEGFGVQMKNRTKGQLEARICEAVIQFEKEFMGRGPLETKAYIIDDLVLVRLRNVLTKAELKLASSSESKDGRELVKRVRITLLEQGRPLLEEAVENILGVKVRSLHTDISTVTGERVILFSLTAPPSIL
jgi:uncharacterized protein YbcI